MPGGALDPSAPEQAIAEIADRVIVALRDELGALAATAPATGGPPEQLSVAQVARLLGVARSTVYAHWREWGGYKLGRGEKAPIRFDAASLPAPHSRPGDGARRADQQGPRATQRRRRRSRLLKDAPRLDLDLRETG